MVLFRVFVLVLLCWCIVMNVSQEANESQLFCVWLGLCSLASLEEKKSVSTHVVFAHLEGCARTNVPCGRRQKAAVRPTNGMFRCPPPLRLGGDAMRIRWSNTQHRLCEAALGEQHMRNNLHPSPDA